MTTYFDHVTRVADVSEAATFRPELRQPPTLSLALHDRGSHCVLELHGELTYDSIVALESQIDQIGCASWEKVVVDVSGLTRLDEAGNIVLAGLHHHMQDRGGRLVITGAREAILARIAGGPYHVDDVDLSAGGLIARRSPAGSSVRGVTTVHFSMGVDEQSSQPNSF